ncbi:NUDIX domain-containing protein [uncultured Clostridium sp.]|uniref:NUDIX hydrolase n=1 Tax=uncultured Clostridium sp. TaxID=59620 RepID=UPI00262F423C|nr:NUDIX domain-containing protein [uncultured Clostridium sp.]
MKVSKKNKDGLTEKEFLEKYDAISYERPSVTVDMVLFTLGEKQKDTLGRKNKEKELKILLIKRGEHPFIDKWAIPGGFVKIGESLGAGVQRKIKEETGLDDIYFEQLYTWGDVDRDPRMRIISASYMALVNNKQLKRNIETDEIAWFSVKKISTGKQKISSKEIHYNYRVSLINEERNIVINYDLIEKIIMRDFDREVCYEYKAVDGENLLAFDHLKIIDYALERMKNKAQYTPIAFSLLPKLFTLTELQQVYEILLGRELIKPNFRRWVNKLVEETDETKKEGAHRPSRLFKLKKEAIIDGVINI